MTSRGGSPPYPTRRLQNWHYRIRTGPPWTIQRVWFRSPSKLIIQPQGGIIQSYSLSKIYISQHVLDFLSDVYWWTPEWCAQGGSLTTRSLQLWHVPCLQKGPVLFYFWHVVGAQQNRKSRFTAPYGKLQVLRDLRHPQVIGSTFTKWDPHLIQVRYWTLWPVPLCRYGIPQDHQSWNSFYSENFRGDFEGFAKREAEKANLYCKAQKILGSQYEKEYLQMGCEGKLRGINRPR